MFNPVIIVPCYNHADAFKQFAPQIAKSGIAVLVVDDGGNDGQSEILRHVCSVHNFKYVRNNVNGGKGRAMQIGFNIARALGFTHGLQIDADGQHNADDILKFIELARDNPNAVIVGNPVYDGSAPRARLIGRRVTDFWVAIETLNLNMPDAMCGMRVYPLDLVCHEMRHLRFYRMGFDIEILVKLYWAGCDIIAKNTRVIYPQNGISNFKMLRDNVYIFLMHTYLCVKMPIGICKRMAKHGKRN